jgi:hypothetical protein
MLGGCLSSALYPLKADVLKKVRTTDPNTGQIKSRWAFSKTIDCAISPFVSTSFKAQPTNETFRQEYEKVQYIKMKTAEGLGREVRITNIRNPSTGDIIYREFELASQPATSYNTMGSAAILDPFGSVIQYDTLLERASDQSDINA